MSEGGSVIYVGDGGNDFCPATKLGITDLVCARLSYPNGQHTSLAKLL